MRHMFLMLAFLAMPAHAETLKGNATFHAIGRPAIISIDGSGAQVSGAVAVKAGIASGKLEADLTKLTTGLELRDKHMHEKYLETGKFPKAVLELENAKVTDGEFPWTGKLTIKGQTKPVKGTAKIRNGQLEAEFTLALADYPAVGVPEFEGVTVSKTVHVAVIAEITK